MENFQRLLKYAAVRGVLIVLTVAISVYVTVVIATMGGYMDKIQRAQIKEQVGAAIQGNEELRRLPQAEFRKIYDQMIAVQEKQYGLDRPWIERSFRYLANAVTLQLGRSEKILSDTGSGEVRRIILERIPATLTLILTAQLILFFTALATALYLSRRYGSPLDRAVVALSPTSAAPAWFYGIFLILFFASLLRVLPYGGMVATPPPKETGAYVLSVLRHLILPVSAWFIGGIFQSVFYWRTFFLINSSEDYVEMAKAKGLPPRALERKYVLRPTLPPVITSFGLMLIGSWTGAIILETVFSWPGLGRLMFQAIGQSDPPVIVGSTVIYAYLLGITVFLLDLLYAALDPRVKLGVSGRRPA